MSSYFDKHARALNNPKEFVKLVRDDYHSYLDKVMHKCLRKEYKRIIALVNEFEDLFSYAKIDSLTVFSTQMFLEDMHDFAHKFGAARIALKGGRIAGDNPNL